MLLARFLILAIALSHAFAQEAQLPPSQDESSSSKPGRCKSSRQTTYYLCHKRYDNCQDDFQCPGDYKCCPRPCGYVCEAPLSETKAAIKMTSASQSTQALTPQELALDLLGLKQPTKKTIDPYSYYYNQMAKSKNRQNFRSLFNGYQAAPNRMQLLNGGQRFSPYNNMVVRTKAYTRNKSPMMEKMTKLSRGFRRPGAKAAKCDCEKQQREEEQEAQEEEQDREQQKSVVESAKIHKLSNKHHRKFDSEKAPQTVATKPERAETLRARTEEEIDPLEEALPKEQALEAEPVFKAGVCPNKFTFGRCLIECYQDSDCDGNKICCHSGCGYSCAIPVAEKPVPGQCPNNKGRIFQCSKPRPTCMRDRDCAFDERCCSIGCQYTCMKV